MKLLWLVAPITLSAALLLAGCGPKAPQDITDSQKQAFDSAPAEIKQVWLRGLEAVKTNDYVTGMNLLYNLLDQQLSPAQKDAVSQESSVIMNRLYDGALNKDPVAINALDELRRNPPNRQPR